MIETSRLTLGGNVRATLHDEGEIITSFDDIHDVWDSLKIGGDDLETVLLRSYITALN